MKSWNNGYIFNQCFYWISLDPDCKSAVGEGNLCLNKPKEVVRSKISVQNREKGKI